MKFVQPLINLLISKAPKKATKDNPLSPVPANTKIHLLKINDDFQTAEELNKALQNIEKSISNEDSKNQLLLQKADLLLRKGKSNQALQLLIRLKKCKKDLKTSNSAKQFLSHFDSLKHQALIKKNKAFINNIQYIAKQYSYQTKNPPEPQDPSFNIKAIQFIREEAQLSRAADLPILSLELIDQALKAGQQSPWLLYGKALSLDMIGQQREALKILEEIKKINKGEKITKSIDIAIKNAQKGTNNYRQTNLNIYLAKHLRAKARKLKVDTEFIPDAQIIDARSGIKSLIYKAALNALPKNPEATINFLDVILDFIPKDGASLLLKGEALFTLKKANKAIQLWAIVAQSNNEKNAQEASKKISKFLARRARKISASQSPQQAITFYIEEHFKLHLTPNPAPQLIHIFKQIDPSNVNFFDPELRQHQLQVEFNTFLIEYLETQLRKQGLLDTDAGVQKPDAIRKTVSKAG